MAMIPKLLLLSKRAKAFSTAATRLKIKTGTYTGDGAATQSVVGVGFSPMLLIIYWQDAAELRTPGFKSDTMGLMATWFESTNPRITQTDNIISLDADGFTVGDNTPGINCFNRADTVYTYIAFGIAFSPSNFATGVYTGDGNATQAITGVGFQPEFVLIWRGRDIGDVDNPYMKADVDGLFAAFWDNLVGHRYRQDMVISLDADGFTVGDGTDFGNILNALNEPYVFSCWGSVGNKKIATGTYTGDGNATQAIAGVGFLPRHVWIFRQTDLDQGAEGRKNDQDGLNAPWYFAGGQTWRYHTTMVISLDADGFTVGDGASVGVNAFNVNGVTYHYVCIG